MAPTNDVHMFINISGGGDSEVEQVSFQKTTSKKGKKNKRKSNGKKKGKHNEDEEESSKTLTFVPVRFALVGARDGFVNVLQAL